MGVNSLLYLEIPFIKPDRGDFLLSYEDALATWASTVYFIYKFHLLNQIEEISFRVVKMLELHGREQFTLFINSI